MLKTAKKSPTKKKYAGKSPATKKLKTLKDSMKLKSRKRGPGARQLTPATKKMTAKQKKAFAGTALGAAIKAAPEPKKKSCAY